MHELLVFVALTYWADNGEVGHAGKKDFYGYLLYIYVILESHFYLIIILLTML
jgi:hypothetical protein